MNREFENAPSDRRMREAANSVQSTFAGTLTELETYDSRWPGNASSPFLERESAPSSETLSEALRHLSTEMRVWQPDVVLVRDAASDQLDLDRLILDLILAAKSDAAEVSDARTESSLPRWKVDHIVLESNSASPAHGSSPIVMTLGVSTAEMASQALSRFVERPLPRPARRAMFVVGVAGTRARIERIDSLFSLSAREEHARRTRSLGNHDVRQLQQQARELRDVAQQLQAAVPPGRIPAEHWLERTRDLSPRSQGEVLFGMASLAEQKGDYESLLVVLRHLVFAMKRHPYTEAAAIWLAQASSSEEIAIVRTNEGRIATSASVADRSDLDPAVSNLSRPQPPHDASPGRVSSTTATGPVSDDVAMELTAPTQLLEQIQRLRPSLFFEPRLRFALAAVRRRADHTEPDQRYFRHQLSTFADSLWRDAALTELAIADETSEQLFARPVAECPSTPDRPLLDGDLGDTCWRLARPIEFGTRVGVLDGKCQAVFTYDDRFLFVAVRCPMVAATEPFEVKSRERDQDLSNRDRVELMFDVDRDYATYWRLAVDDLGRGADSVGNNASWNPVWYFSTRHTSTEWTLEAAIHLEELTQATPVTRATWLMGVQRTVPGHGLQAWHQSTAPDPAATSFGVLRFIGP